MIPKIIHYCWLGGNPIPMKLQRYIETWRKKLPEYELMLWNESNFNTDSCNWVKQACEQKKYAYAADYIRFYALYNYGGIYLDTDVQVLRSYNPFLDLHTMVGYENSLGLLEVSTFGSEKENPCLKVILDYYEENDFVYNESEMKEILCQQVVTRVLMQNNYQFVNVKTINEALKYKNNRLVIPVFPSDFFSPKDWSSQLINVSDNTFSIHNYSSTWIPDHIRRRRYLKDALPQWLLRLIRKIKPLD